MKKKKLDKLQTDILENWCCISCGCDRWVSPFDEFAAEYFSDFCPTCDAVDQIQIDMEESF